MAQPDQTQAAPDIADYRPAPEPGVAHRVWILASEPGGLELRDARMRLLAGDHSERPMLAHTFTPTDGVFEQALFLRFEPLDGLAGTQRLLSVRPDRELHLILGRTPEGAGHWHLLEVEPAAFEQAQAILPSSLTPPLWTAPDDLERELLALLELDAAGPSDAPETRHADDRATRLRDEGMQRLASGDYHGALERLEESLALTPDAELADRVARLRAYLQIRSE